MKHAPSARWLYLPLVTLLLACSGEPTAPPAALEPQPQDSWNHGDWGWWNHADDDDGDFDVDMRWIARFKSPPSGPPLVNALIGPEGGSLRLGDFEIIVPAGAVERPTQFRIRLPTRPDQANRAMAEFTPHQYFRKPVTIRLPATSTEVNGVPYVLWWARHFWLPMPTQPTSDGRIEAKVWHFSIYGTSFWAKDWGMAGG